jgi:hypothetical protein
VNDGMRRRRGLRSAIAIATIAALAVAACGSGATDAPGDSTGGDSPGASTARPTLGPAGSIDITAAGAFDNATSRLDALDSYRFDVEIRSSSTSTIGSSGVTSLSGVVVHRPDEESQYDEVTRNATGTITSELHAIIIGNQAWLKDSGDASYQPISPSSVSTMILAFGEFRPEQMFGRTVGTLGAGFHFVGDEVKNGISSAHYAGDDSVSSAIGALAGVEGSLTSDVWLAKDGGYLVSSSVSASAADPSAAGSFSIAIEITNVNDPANRLSPPA